MATVKMAAQLSLFHIHTKKDVRTKIVSAKVASLWDVMLWKRLLLFRAIDAKHCEGGKSRNVNKNMLSICHWMSPFWISLHHFSRARWTKNQNQCCQRISETLFTLFLRQTLGLPKNSLSFSVCKHLSVNKTKQKVERALASVFIRYLNSVCRLYKVNKT